MSDVFKELPRLTKLVLDLNNPVDIMNDGFTLAELYIRAEDMEPLLNQTKLKELRLLRLRDSLQFIAWQTVFLNEAEGGMRILELQMHQAPIVRRDDWRKAVDVHNLTVAHAGLLEKEYKSVKHLHMLGDKANSLAEDSTARVIFTGRSATENTLTTSAFGERGSFLTCRIQSHFLCCMSPITPDRCDHANQLR